MVFGLKTTVFLLILLALTTCTCSGPRLMLGSQSSESLIEYSIFTGKRVKQTIGLMECAILKTEGLASPLCLHLNPLLKQQLLPMHGLGYCPNLELMLKKCSQIRLYQYQQTTPSFSSQYKTEWTGQRQSSHTGSQRPSLPEKTLNKQKQTSSQDLTQLSIGKIQATIPMTVKNSGYSCMMNLESGSDPIISSTVGASLKLVLD